MNREQTWKNFDLGQEVSVSGAFIYNGLRRFHEMQTLDQTDEVFEFLYNLAVGFERILKVAVVLLEHDGTRSQEQFEQSLVTHDHLGILQRVRQYVELDLGGPHHELLDLLGNFYKTLRYDRFTLSAHWDPSKEKTALRSYLEKNLQVTLGDHDSIFPTLNDARFRKHIGRVVGKISDELYRVVRSRASELNLHTYELRHGSKAEKVFLSGERNFVSEDVLQKELLVFFMNAKATSGLMKFLKSIPPLDFDEALAGDYLQCFQSVEAAAYVIGELEELYANLDDPGRRLELMNVVGNPNVCFDDENEDDEEERSGSVVDGE